MLNEIRANICEQWIQPVSGKWWEIIIFAIFYFTVVDVGVFFRLFIYTYSDIYSGHYICAIRTKKIPVQIGAAYRIEKNPKIQNTPPEISRQIRKCCSTVPAYKAGR